MDGGVLGLSAHVVNLSPLQRQNLCISRYLALHMNHKVESNRKEFSFLDKTDLPVKILIKASVCECAGLPYPIEIKLHTSTLI